MNRAKRRRQLKEDERLIANGLSFTRIDTFEAIALMHVLRGRLAQLRSAGKIAQVISAFHP